jgi:hypothetical protein
LHNSKNWDTYRQIIQEKVNLKINFKEHQDIEIESNNILNLFTMLPKELPQTAIPPQQQIT